MTEKNNALKRKQYKVQPWNEHRYFHSEQQFFLKIWRQRPRYFAAAVHEGGGVTSQRGGDIRAEVGWQVRGDDISPGGVTSWLVTWPGMGEGWQVGGGVRATKGLVKPNNSALILLCAWQLQQPRTCRRSWWPLKTYFAQKRKTNKFWLTPWGFLMFFMLKGNQKGWGFVILQW